MTGITLPTDTQQSRLTPRPAEAQEDVLDTLREYERLARVATPDYTIASRFTADGETWAPIWLRKEPPAGVHTVVSRDGVVTEEWRSWDEALPADEASVAAWLANPATRLRAFTERATLRRAFADVIVGRDQPAPREVAPPTPRPAPMTHPWDEDVWAPAPGPSVTAQGPATPGRVDEIARRVRPQDHLPGNRADRRAAKRKSGRRR